MENVLVEFGTTWFTNAVPPKVAPSLSEIDPVDPCGPLGPGTPGPLMLIAISYRPIYNYNNHLLTKNVNSIRVSLDLFQSHSHDR